VGDEIDPLSVPWVAELQHKSRPNEVGSTQMPARPSEYQARTGTAATIPPDVATAVVPRGPTANPVDPANVPSYYDVSMLKAPLWKWEIASYFFLGGLSAGAFLIARMAERFGGEDYADVTRAASYIAGGTVVACPPLLIHDLGDPKRFHHMLRVWKPSSPMNLGTWALTAYSGAAAASVVREYLRGRDVPAKSRSALSKLTGATLLAVHDAAGIPLAILVAGYTGVLLSSSANPLWCQNPWLGALFSAGAVSTGAAATDLALALSGVSPDAPSRRALKKIDTVAHAAEGLTLAGFLKHAGERAEPLTRGSMHRQHQVAIAGMIASELLKHMPAPRGVRKWTSALGSVAGLVGGFALRWAMVHGGHEAGNDPRQARRISRGTARVLPKQSSNVLKPGQPR
jgi:formate-dependent nitrite reductase membrane component NrfD